jgi:hypothetical protein
MDFDFAELYKSYTTVELLKIIRHPEKYQDAAVDAANNTLETRTVTDTEREAAGFEIVSPESHSYPTPGRSYPSPDKDLLELFNLDAAEEKYKKWFNVIFIMIALYYLRLVYFSAVVFHRFVEDDSYPFIPLFIALFYILGMPLVLLNFYRKKRIGWLLLLAESSLSFLFTFIYIINNAEYLSLRKEVIYYLIPFLLKPFIIAFLLQKKTITAFSITTELKRKTFFSMIVAACIILGYMYIVKTGKAI